MPSPRPASCGSPSCRLFLHPSVSSPPRGLESSPLAPPEMTLSDLLRPCPPVLPFAPSSRPLRQSRASSPNQRTSAPCRPRAWPPLPPASHGLCSRSLAPRVRRVCNLQETTEAAPPPPYTPGLRCPFLADEVCHPFSLPKLNLLSKCLLLSFGVRLSHVDSEFQIRLDWESVSGNS
jgi:hypothetical protein